MKEGIGNIDFKTRFSFKGSESDFQKVLLKAKQLSKNIIFGEITAKMGILVTDGKFTGTITEFEKVANGLFALFKEGLMIDTVPVPDSAAIKVTHELLPKGVIIVIGKQKLAEGGVIVDYLDGRKRRIGCLAIGSWPTPERELTPLIDTVPLPERIAENINEYIENMSRVKLQKSICLGIRTPHIHIEDEIIFLNQDNFKKLAGQIALDFTQNLVKQVDYFDVTDSLRNLIHK